jgi:hypothetical protein
MAAPGMMPPLQLSLGSSAKSGDASSQGGASGMGSLSQGAWNVNFQSTGTGNNSSTATQTGFPSIGGGDGGWLLPVALGAGVAWLLLRR